MKKKNMEVKKNKSIMHVFKLSALSSIVFLAGCTLAPSYERPGSPVANQWPDMNLGVEGQESTGLAANDLEWQKFFGDERLKQLIGIALENNRDMRVAVLNIEKARAMYQVQRADLLPGVDVSAQNSRQSTGHGGKSDTSLWSHTAKTVGASDRNTYTASIGITSYELDLFGRIRSLNAAALASYMSSVEARKSAQISLISNVAMAYYALLADDDLLRITEETLRTRDESLKLTTLKFENGVSSELDVRQAQTLVESARSTLSQLRRQRAQDENALVLLLGTSMPETLPQGAPFSQQMNLLPELYSGIPSEVLVRRPDVVSAEQQLISANANIGAARAAFFPRITLTATLGKASNELDSLFSSGRVWNFVPQISLPIFTGGRNVANLEVSQVNRDIAVAQYEKSIQSAFMEVSDALAGRATYGDQLEAMQALVRATQRAYELSDLRYRNGVSSYMDLLDSQRSLFEAQQQEIAAQLAMLNNQVTLYKVLGGGWSSSDEEHMQHEFKRADQAREEKKSNNIPE